MVPVVPVVQRFWVEYENLRVLRAFVVRMSQLLRCRIESALRYSR
jgi:hypothetical protein